MEIQQHDGVVEEVAGFQQGFAKRCGRREMCHGREREAPGLSLCCPPFPPLYIGPRERGGAALALPPRKGAAREESILPKAPRRCLPPLGLSPFPPLLAHGPIGAGALGPCRPRRTPYSPCGPRGRWPHPVDPRDPSGGPGTIPVTPKLVPMPEIALPIYNSLPPDHSGTPRDIRDLIRDSKQLSGYRILISL